MSSSNCPEPSTCSSGTLRTPIGARFPPHCTAAAKATLAYLPEDEAEAILSINTEQFDKGDALKRWQKEQPDAKRFEQKSGF